MEHAVAAFRTRMRSANSTFLSNAISRLEDHPIPESLLLQTLSKIWFRWDESHTSFQRLPPPTPSASPLLHAQYACEVRVSSLADVKLLEHRHIDGTEPARPASEREIALRVLAEEMQAHADLEMLGYAESEWEVEFPSELGEFLACTNGVYEVDFRKSGMCDFALPGYAPGNLVDMRLAMRWVVDRDEWDRMGLQMLELEWDVAAGVLMGHGGQWPEFWPEFEDQQWYTLYVLCRRAVEEDEEKEEWRWRVLVWHRLVGDKYTYWAFESIVEFLEWYAAWEDRFDPDAYRAAFADYPPEWPVNTYAPV